MGGTAPGLPGPEALEVEWSSSSSEESPVYATKPVFILFTADSETGREGANKKEGRGSTFGKGERKTRREKTQKKQQQQHFLRQVQVNYIQTHFGRNK